MMRKINLWHYMCVLLLLVAAVQGCRKDSFYGLDDGGKPDDPLLHAAKVWHHQNLEFAQKRRSKTSDLDITKLHFQWDKHGISKNQQGKPVLTVPIRYAGQAKDTYVELGFIVDAEGNANGMIKEYLGDPFVGNTPLNLYSGTGHRFLSGTFIRSRKSMAVDIRRSQGLKSGLQKLASTGGGGGNTTIDGGTIEEVLVTAQQNNWGGGGGGTYLGIISGGVFHEGGISDNEPPPNSNIIETVTVIGYTSGVSGSDTWYQGTYSQGNYSSIPVIPGVSYIVVAADPNKKLHIIPSSDSCLGRSAVYERLNLTEIKKDIATIKLLGPINGEHMFETDLNTDTYIASNKVVHTNNNRHEVDYRMSWSSAGNTLTVGFTHIHTFDSAPSAKDLFVGRIGFVNPGGPTMSSAQQQMFLEYFTSTVVTENATYVITIKDQLKWREYTTDAAVDQAQAKWLEAVDQYMEKNNGASNSEAQEHALLKLFGDVVNIYKAPRNHTGNNFEPLTLDSSGNPITASCN